MAKKKNSNADTYTFLSRHYGVEKIYECGDEIELEPFQAEALVNKVVLKEDFGRVTSAAENKEAERLASENAALKAELDRLKSQKDDDGFVDPDEEEEEVEV